MRIARLTRPDELAELGVAWNALSQGVVFRRFEWVESWWRHYGQGPEGARRELYVLAAWDDDRLVGAAPWYVDRSPRWGRIVRFLGCGDVCSDYLTLLAAPGRETEVADAVVDYLEDHAAEWDLLDMAGIARGDVPMEHLIERFSQHRCRVYRRPGPACWRIPLPQSWEEYLTGLSKGHRKQLRRLQSRVVDSQRASLHVADDRDQLEQGWEVLVDLHQRRRRSLGQPGCFTAGPYAGFHREVAGRLLDAGALRLAWLELDGRPIAAEYHFSGDGEVYAYQSGLDPDRLDEEPGRLMLVALLPQAIAAGYRGFDLLRGDEPYKAHVRAVPQATESIHVVPHRTLPRLRHGAWLAGASMKQFVRTGLNRYRTWVGR